MYTNGPFTTLLPLFTIVCPFLQSLSLSGGRMAAKSGEVRGDVLLGHPDVHAAVKYSQPHHPVRPLPLHLGHQEHPFYGQVFCPVARYV